MTSPKNTINLLRPTWPAPKNVEACTTLRAGGVSSPPFDEANFAMHVGDKAENVARNRQLLVHTLNLPSEPIWLQQTHSNRVLEASSAARDEEADAIISHKSNEVCVVMTADCLPLLITHKEGKSIAAIHAGWRGLLNNIIRETILALKHPGNDLVAWLGPAIGPQQFEVGREVREAFLDQNSTYNSFFVQSKPAHWHCDLYAIARSQLQEMGIFSVYGGEFCTMTDQKSFFSYRRDGEKTGRMASLIWINDLDLSH